MALARILISGGSGLLGSALIRRWQGGAAPEYELWGLSRQPKKARERFPDVFWVASVDELPKGPWLAVINLAGESIAEGRWNYAKKQRMVNSRLSVTREILRFCLKVQPQVLLSGSAIGYYGLQGDQSLTEAAASVDGFSHRLCQQWEQEVEQMRSQLANTRVCFLRTGVVLTDQGGALAKMLLPFKLGLGGHMGTGNQYFSWIHLSDWLSAVEFLLVNSQVSGPVNLTAPVPVTNKEFSKTLAKVLKRPCIFPMPALVAKLAFGEMAEELLLAGQKVVPAKLLEAGFQFKFLHCLNALGNILSDTEKK